MQPSVWGSIAMLLRSLELLASAFGAVEAIDAAQGVEVAYAALSAAHSDSEEAKPPATGGSILKSPLSSEFYRVSVTGN